MLVKRAMTQELVELRQHILDARYDDALALVDELEEISKQSILRNIESFLIRLLVHLIKNQIKQRLTNSWAASISDSILRIQKLDLRANKSSHYVNADEWLPFLEESLEAAIAPACVEALNGKLTPMQISGYRFALKDGIRVAIAQGRSISRLLRRERLRTMTRLEYKKYRC